MELPLWLKVTRRGDSFSGYLSNDGAQWLWIGSERVEMAEDAYVGFAVISHDNNQDSMAFFDEVTVRNPVGMDGGSFASGRGYGEGLVGTYTDKMTSVALSRLDKTVDFDWGMGSPAEGIREDHFEVTWEGFLEAEFSEPYLLHLMVDDGARLWLGQDLLIDAWRDGAVRQESARVQLEAGRKYPLRIEYYENTQDAVMKFLWNSPSTPRQVVPQSRLYVTADPSSLLSRSGEDGEAQLARYKIACAKTTAWSLLQPQARFRLPSSRGAEVFQE